jgi:trehalose 6-phosphate phosphatase
LIYALSPAGRAKLVAGVTAGALLAVDIDGTLAPIVERPDDARLPDDVQSCLAELAQRTEVAIITGRGVDDARRMLRFEPRYLVGNHGLEGLPGWSERAQTFARLARGWREAMYACASMHDAGVTLEDKQYSLSLHYRRAANPYAAHKAIRRCVDSLEPPPHVIEGKAVVNLLPPDAPDKGDALRVLIGETHRSNVLYVGDDDTDETVFGLHLPSVLTLRVEPAADSEAALFLRDQREVYTLMQHIAREWPRTEPGHRPTA